MEIPSAEYIGYCECQITDYEDSVSTHVIILPKTGVKDGLISRVSLVAPLVRDQAVGGSNPLAPTSKKKHETLSSISFFHSNRVTSIFCQEPATATITYIRLTISYLYPLIHAVSIISAVQTAIHFFVRQSNREQRELLLLTTRLCL